MFQNKQVFKLNILKKLLDDENGCVSLVPTTRVLALPPFFLNDMKSGILYLLNNMLKKYDRSLGGIVIGYQNIKVLMDENTGIIPMGTAEIEVDISVEFYIFQPKIGSLLEGIVNKKSNSHIGCLVHQYFNATILKPEDVEFDDWICKDFDVNDKIIFKVKDLDFTTLIPYIEGVIEENFPKKSSKCVSETRDIGDVHKGVQDVTCKQKSLTRLKSDKSDVKDSECTKEQDKVSEPKEDGFSLEKYVSLEDEDSNDFVGPLKSKNKKQKKKTKENKSLNESLECQPSRGEDNVFTSTQLEPKSKMTNWFCSPIPRGMSSGTAEGKNVASVREIPSQVKGTEKEKKKKHKKRSREEEDEVESVPKKVKKSETDALMEALLRKQVKTPVKNSKESEGKKNAKKMSRQNEDSVARLSNVNGSGQTSSERDTFYDLGEQNTSGKKEWSDVFGKDSSGKKSKEDAGKSLKVKKNKKDKSGGVGSSGEEKSTDSGRKKPKTAENDREGADDSLQKRILEKTRNEILEKFKLSISSPTRDAGKMANKKDSELSDLSAGSSKSKHSRKKSKHKEKLKHRPGTREEFKNGSMYDLPSSPEKPDYDKSLFTDSEQSHASPAKKRKEVNGIEAGVSEKKPQPLPKFNLFSNERTSATTKSESDKEMSKQTKKRKSKRKSEGGATQRESLFEKLLEQAKRLVDIKEESFGKKE